MVTCSRGVHLTPDRSLEEALKAAPAEPAAVADVIVLPGGGGGSQKLRESQVLYFKPIQSELPSREFVADRRWIGE